MVWIFIKSCLVLFSQLDEFQSPSSIALHLAGLQAQADYGNFDESKLSRLDKF